VADGKYYTLDPVQFTFESAADASLMQVDIHGVKSHAWLGDVMPITLKILVKPYADTQLPDGALSAADMWRMLDVANSRWGPFQPAVSELLETGGVPGVTIATVEGQRWYAYGIKQNVRLLKSGEFDLSDVLIRLNYPQEIGRGRSSLFDPIPRLQVTRSRPVTAAPEDSYTLVASPPESGRPAGWSGAVGQFAFDVSATPTDVVVGEPITLTMRITDVGATPADMELLSAPLLEQDDSLTHQFRIPADRPGGVLKGRSKTFTQSIRPTSDAVEQIPPIGFSFFNPQTDAYEISFSRPVDLQVTSSTRLDADAFTGTMSVVAQEPRTLTEVNGGLVANYNDPNALLRRATNPGQILIATIVSVPPIFLATVMLLRRRQTDPDRDKRKRMRSARSRFAERLADIQTASEAAQALRDAIADRLNLPSGSATRDELKHALIESGALDVAESIHEMLCELEHRVYAAASNELDQEMHTRLIALVDKLEMATR
ncbi:MAG: BatD family protein, partial [Phycisphaerales bacterium]|nr:BatD family protein [Phycisphaerales bacterium]